MASHHPGFNDAKLAWGNWDYVDLSHFIEVPRRSIKSSAMSLMKECGAKAHHPGLIAGVASFSAGLALHRIRKSHGRHRALPVTTLEKPSLPSELCPEEKLHLHGNHQWLPLLKATAAVCLLLAASRKVRKHCSRSLSSPVKPVKAHSSNHPLISLFYGSLIGKIIKICDINIIDMYNHILYIYIYIIVLSCTCYILYRSFCWCFNHYRFESPAPR